ncbi:MAG: arginine--tRNA ligase [Gammaproteobacteria bacterium CG11_big_fil_rev_8_21_14_0_20_46_22]|nr:MAG: arginine--tRNA ligase [Gammaproteobacteria bacterium CG12_big_fil_rev_8_21_14_0_65_46_12]PIR10717.1 MAG: arginine--tRNA ligase [Gammaproteobacteria bacterium CG11_big_fil_rev_8_21_14_0_20_46_22]
MKQTLEQLIQKSLDALSLSNTRSERRLDIVLEHCKNKAHGDLACNIALMLAKHADQKPRELAEAIIRHLPAHDMVEKVEIAGPGFINFFIKTSAQFAIVDTVLYQGDKFGRSTLGENEKVHIEFVSANPTGPLHVGHGRGAAYGSALASILSNAGYDVYREYYVNDAGRQMHILATSVWLRYLSLEGQRFDFPSNGYKGDYIIDIAKNVQQAFGDSLVHTADAVFSDVPLDEGQENGDKEEHIDALINHAQGLLGEHYERVFNIALDAILDDIREDLAEFNVHYEDWFSEKSLMDNGAVSHGIEKLQSLGYCYEQDGAIWFKSTEFGDEKDRVLQRDDGRTTYFASDVAYHLNKVERGFTHVIDVLGADHHGYVPRVRASMKALGVDDQHFRVPLVQFAVLYRGSERVQMSTRSGSFVTLRELREEVGNDAARFFYVMRKAEQHMDFDLELAKSKTNENPVYYVQYAHARICSVHEKLKAAGRQFDQTLGLANLDKLSSEYEEALAKALSRYPEVCENAAKHLEPHLVANYLRELAQALHTYYNAEQFIVDDDTLCQARFALITATGQTLKNGLSLLGISAPRSM